MRKPLVDRGKLQVGKNLEKSIFLSLKFIKNKNKYMEKSLE